MDTKKIATDKKNVPLLPASLSLKKKRKKVKSFDHYLMNQHYSNYHRGDIYNSIFNHYYSYLCRRQ